MLISLPAGTMVMLGILCTKNSSWSIEWLMRLTSALILFDLMFLTLLRSKLITAFSLLVLLTNTFMALNPKIGLSSELLDSSDISNVILVYPRNDIFVLLPHWTCSLSHGFNNSPASKMLAPGKLLSSYLCDSRDTWASVSSKTCVTTSFILHAT